MRRGGFGRTAESCGLPKARGSQLHGHSYTNDSVNNEYSDMLEC